MDTVDTMELNTPLVTPAKEPVKQLEAVAPPDKHIWGIYILLCLISIIELYSASSREVASSSIGVLGPIFRHVMMLGAGCVIILLMQRVPYNKLMGFSKLFILLSAGMMLYVMLFGDVVNGARRSFNLAGITIQPSEFLKLSAVLIIARYTSLYMQKNGGVHNRGVIISALAVMIFGGLLIQQGMTNTILLMAISFSMMLIGGIELKKICIVVGVYIVFALAAYGIVHASSSDDSTPAVEQVSSSGEPVVNASGEKVNRSSTWGSRISRHFNPVPPYEQPITAKNRQEQYSYMAQANGGIIGVFPGNSRETARLPLAFSDYIFAIIVEDLGLIGGFVVLLLYLWLLGRAAAIAMGCKRALPALLVLGIAVMIAYQAMFHMAIVSGFFPVSGQPLPLLSKGGTSILITSIAFGIMLSVSRFAVRKATRKQITDEMNALPEEMRADNPTMLH